MASTIYTYSQLGNIATVLGSIEDKKLQQGFEVQVRSDKTLKFVQPWGAQRAKAWTTSTYNGVSQRDQKMETVLDRWLANCRTCDTFFAGSMGLDQETQEDFIKAFGGLITLGNYYITVSSKGKGPYYDAKMETAKKVLKVALQYRIGVLDKKVPIAPNESEVSAQYEQLKTLIKTHFSKKTKLPEQSSQKTSASQSQDSQPPAYDVPATVVSSEQTGEFLGSLAELMQRVPMGVDSSEGRSSSASAREETPGLYPKVEEEEGGPS